MNKLFILLTCLIGSVACSTQPENAGTTVDSSTAKPAVSEEQQRQAERLHGFWLTDSYLKAISKTRSIYRNRDYASQFFGFTLDKENLLSDSAYLNGFSTHEGGFGSFLVFDAGKNKFVKDTRQSEEKNNSFELEVSDDSLMGIYYPKTKTTDVYRKVKDEQSELRRILLAGDYRMIGDKDKVIFEEDGTLKGFKGMEYYELIYDFGEGIEYDAVIMYPSKEGGNWSEGDLYKWEFRSDTLNLYYVKTDWEEMDHKIKGGAIQFVKE